MAALVVYVLLPSSLLAVLVDGAYTSAAHLGPDGPAAAGLGLARDLVRQGRTQP